MRINIPDFASTWDVAAIFSPAVALEQQEAFADFMLDMVKQEFTNLVTRLTEQELAFQSKFKTFINGYEFNTTELVSFVSSSLVLTEGPSIEFNDNKFSYTGVTADQVARILEYGNLENKPGSYISRVFKRVNMNTASYWAIFYATQ